jgi:hypothetical protein
MSTTDGSISDVNAGRWNISSWLALSFALLLFGTTSILIWQDLQLPIDGWRWTDDHQFVARAIRNPPEDPPW